MLSWPEQLRWRRPSNFSRERFRSRAAPASRRLNISLSGTARALSTPPGSSSDFFFFFLIIIFQHKSLNAAGGLDIGDGLKEGGEEPHVGFICCS